MRLKQYFENEKDENKLLSVNQQRSIKSCLQMIVSIGLLPKLIPGVGLNLNVRSQYAHLIQNESLTVIQVSELK